MATERFCIKHNTSPELNNSSYALPKTNPTIHPQHSISNFMILRNKLLRVHKISKSREPPTYLFYIESLALIVCRWEYMYILFFYWENHCIVYIRSLKTAAGPERPHGEHLVLPSSLPRPLEAGPGKENGAPTSRLTLSRPRPHLSSYPLL